MATTIDATRITNERLHKRIQIVEWVLLLSLILNVLSGGLALHNKKDVEQLQNVTGVQK